MSGNEVIFRKESQIEERELRLLTELPDCCAAGTNLMNLIFQVMELDGSLDTSIHHDEKPGCFHTMSIESDSSSIESAIRYAFVHGSCKVSSLSLPENEGVFSCRVFHSRYPELQMSVKIQGFLQSQIHGRLHVHSLEYWPLGHHHHWLSVAKLAWWICHSTLRI